MVFTVERCIIPGTIHTLPGALVKYCRPAAASGPSRSVNWYRAISDDGLLLLPAPDVIDTSLRCGTVVFAQPAQSAGKVSVSQRNSSTEGPVSQTWLDDILADAGAQCFPLC